MKKLDPKTKDKAQGIAFLSPSLLGVCIFFILPFFVVFYYSLIDSPGNRAFVGLENYRALLKNGAFQLAAKNTAIFSCTAVPLSVILGLALARMLERRIPGQSAFRTIFLSPMMVPVVSVVLIWQIIFNYNGTLNESLSLFGLDKIDWLSSNFCQAVTVLLFLWKNLGYNMILFMAGLANIPKDVLEAASMDGASDLYQFFHIKLRYLSSTILFVTILSLISSFKVFREIYLLTGDYPYEGLYTLQHFMNNTFRSLDYQKLSSAAVIMGIVIISVVAVLFCLESRYGKDVDG